MAKYKTIQNKKTHFYEGINFKGSEPTKEIVVEKEIKIKTEYQIKIG